MPFNRSLSSGCVICKISIISFWSYPSMNRLATSNCSVDKLCKYSFVFSLTSGSKSWSSNVADVEIRSNVEIQSGVGASSETSEINIFSPFPLLLYCYDNDDSYHEDMLHIIFCLKCSEKMY